VTTRTNGFNETEIIGGHDKFFALWPFYFNETTGIGTDNPEKWHASLLIYAQSRSPQRDYTSVIWPFFAWIDDRGGKYREWELPWPIRDCRARRRQNHHAGFSPVQPGAR
jgi:hypothetical protein